MGLWDSIFGPSVVGKKLDKLLALVQEIKEVEGIIMATLDDILVGVAEEHTQIESLAALTANIKQMLADALSGVILPPGVQEKIDAIFAGVSNNTQEVVDAINENALD